MSEQESRVLDATIQEGLQKLLEEAVELVGGQRGLIASTVPLTEDMNVEAAAGLDRDTAWTMGQISRTLLRKVANTKRGLLTQDALEDKRLNETTSVVLSGLRSAVCEPILLRDEAWGVLYVDNLLRSGAFTPSHLKKLKEFTEKVTQFLEHR
ncbi:MAG: GAF domain-containing protein [Candidatus Xenobia bacterium]